MKENLLQSFVLKLDRVKRETNIEKVLVVSPTWAIVAAIRFDKSFEVICTNRGPSENTDKCGGGVGCFPSRADLGKSGSHQI